MWFLKKEQVIMIFTLSGNHFSFPLTKKKLLKICYSADTTRYTETLSGHIKQNSIQAL